MQNSTALTLLLVALTASVAAAQSRSVERFGRPQQDAASRVPLLPGPYVLSPPGTNSTGGRTWKTLPPRLSDVNRGTGSAAGDAKNQPRTEAAPKTQPPADSLRFREQLPKLDTSLPNLRPQPKSE